MLRRSPLLLLLTAAACFSDAPPSGLSTSGSVSASSTGTTAPGLDATGPDATSTSTSTSTSGTPVTTSATTTTTEALTTTSVTTGELTTDDLTMGATVTSTSGPGTTDADPYATCGAAPTQSECFDCCRGTQGGDWEVFRGNLAGCVCPDVEHPCFAGCFDPLCNTDTLDEACFGCFTANDTCVAEAVAQCVSYPECAAFVGCLDGAACFDKP